MEKKSEANRRRFRPQLQGWCPAELLKGFSAKNRIGPKELNLMQQAILVFFARSLDFKDDEGKSD